MRAFILELFCFLAFEGMRSNLFANTDLLAWFYLFLKCFKIRTILLYFNVFPFLQDYPQLLWNGNTKTTQRESWQQLLQVSGKHCRRNFSYDTYHIMYWFCSYYMNVSELLLCMLIRKKAEGYLIAMVLVTTELDNIQYVIKPSDPHSDFLSNQLLFPIDNAI